MTLPPQRPRHVDGHTHGYVPAADNDWWDESADADQGEQVAAYSPPQPLNRTRSRIITIVGVLLIAAAAVAVLMLAGRANAALPGPLMAGEYPTPTCTPSASASASPSVSASVSTSPDSSPSASPSPVSPSAIPSISSAVSASPSHTPVSGPSAGSSTSSAAAAGSLPLTGVPLGGLLVVAGIAIGVGVAAVFAGRRARRADAEPVEE